MSFKQFTKPVMLMESKGKMLDISIKAYHKVLTNDDRIKEFLSSKVIIEEKTDGIKITALKIDNKGDINDWILAYKNDIIHDGEFLYLDDKSIKNHSISNAQFKFIFDHFKNNIDSSKKIPIGTELFIEYLMKKPTLSSNYKVNHGMVLISHTKSSHRIKGNKLFTKPSGFYVNKRKEYSKLLKIDYPNLLFSGKLGTMKSFETGIVDDLLKTLFNDMKYRISWDTPSILYEEIGKMLISVESKYGGVMEGVICQYNDKIIKFQKEGQVDKDARNKIKMRYKDERVELENIFWDNVRKIALDVIDDIDRSLPFRSQLLKVSDKLKNYKLDFTHSKKNNDQIIDDIQGNCKMILSKQMKGSNGSMISGRFQPFTLGHKKMFDLAFKKTDYVVVNIVKGRKVDLAKNPFPSELQKEMIRAIYPTKNIEFTESFSGNLITIMSKSEQNINVFWCGTDRYESYKTQLQRNPDLRVEEIKRSSDDISATKVRKAIKNNDFEAFKKLVPIEIHSYFDNLKQFFI